MTNKNYRIDPEHVAQFCGPLRRRLKRELFAGNRVAETWRDWPRLGCTVILLAKPFCIKTGKLSEGVVFRHVGDPHYWLAEYDDTKNNMMLLCRF